MTRTLILIRHAKSDWADLDLPDHDRPLNARGLHAAPKIGAYLARSNLRPDTVLCSTARRTQDTWAGIASQLPNRPDPVFTRSLYDATPSAILTAIRSTDGTTLAVIGHNPGIGSLAWSLAHIPPRHEKFGLYPTGATTILTFDADDWSGIGAEQGTVADFVVPRDLPDA